MSTEFNFPANPTNGQIVLLPNGASAQWNGTEWVSVGDTTVTYPLAVTLGGTGATTPSQARFNLGLNTATGEFIVQKDGTVAAPGIAFASEPGLGWFRNGASIIGVAARGNRIWDVQGATSVTYNVLYPSAVSADSMVILTNQPSGAVNFNTVNLTQHGDGHGSLATGIAGTVTRGNLTLDAPQVLLSASNVAVNAKAGSYAQIVLNKPSGTASLASVVFGSSNGKLRWGVNLGNAASETGSNLGSDFSISRFDDAGNYASDPLVISRLSGGANFPAAIQARAMYGGGAASDINIFPAGDYVNGAPGWPATNGGVLAIRGSTSASYAAGGALSAYSGSGNTGSTLFNGSNAWSTNSDERLKTIHGEITDGLEAVLAMRPIRYNYLTDEPDYRVRVGLTAQSVQIGVPEAITEAPLLEEDPETHGPRSSSTLRLQLAITDTIPALVSAIQTLNQRLTQVENQL